MLFRSPLAVAPRQPRVRPWWEGPFWRRLRESPLSGVSLRHLSRVAVCPVAVTPGERGPEAPPAGAGPVSWAQGEPCGRGSHAGVRGLGECPARAPRTALVTVALPEHVVVLTSPQSSERGVASGQMGQRPSAAGTCVPRTPGRPAGRGAPGLRLGDGGPALPRVPGSPHSASHRRPPPSSTVN